MKKRIKNPRKPTVQMTAKYKIKIRQAYLKKILSVCKLIKFMKALVNCKNENATLL